MRIKSRWAAGLVLMSSVSIAATPPPTQRNFVACPIMRDTETVPCWLAEYNGELYYLGIQTDVGGEWYPPYLGYKALIEGKVSDETRICGGIVLKEGRASVLRDPDPSCNTLLPSDPRYQLPFEPPRGPGPSGLRAPGAEPMRGWPAGLFVQDPSRPRTPPQARPAPPAPPKAPFQPTEFRVDYDFDRYIWFGRQTVVPLDDALDFAELSKAERIEITGYRGAILLSDGSVMAEEDGIGRIRAQQIADLYVQAGYPRDKLTVRWSEEIPSTDGVNDYKHRKAIIRVIPG